MCWFIDLDQTICFGSGNPVSVLYEGACLSGCRAELVPQGDGVTGSFQTAAALLFSSLLWHQCSFHVGVKQIFIVQYVWLAGAVYSVTFSIFLCDIGILFFYSFLSPLSVAFKQTLPNFSSKFWLVFPFSRCFYCNAGFMTVPLFCVRGMKRRSIPRKCALLCRSLFLSLKAPLSPAHRLFFFMQINFHTLTTKSANFPQRPSVTSTFRNVFKHEGLENSQPLVMSQRVKLLHCHRSQVSGHTLVPLPCFLFKAC